MHIVLLAARDEVIEELHGLGHTLTVLYTGWNKPAVDRHADQIAHTGYVPDFDFPELAWSVLLHLDVADRVDLVIPCHEIAIVTAGFLNRVLGLSARERLDLPTAMAGRDKPVQKALWTRHGVPTARYATVTNAPTSVAELGGTVAGLSAPFVVKPPSRGGSEHVHSCATVADLFDVLTEQPDLRHAVIEEMQHGREWHLDGAVYEGRIEHFSVSRYLAPLIETKNGSTLRSVAYPGEEYRDLYATAREFAQNAVDALGGRYVTFHLEVFGEPGAFVAGELAWRPPGVYAPQSVERTIGVNLWTSHARLLAGYDLQKAVPVGDTVFGFVCLPVKPGAVNGVTGEDIEALPGVRQILLAVKPGQVMREMHTSTTCVALALIEGKDVDDCERLIDQAVELTNELHDRKSVT